MKRLKRLRYENGVKTEFILDDVSDSVYERAMQKTTPTEVESSRQWFEDYPYTFLEIILIRSLRIIKFIAKKLFSPNKIINIVFNWTLFLAAIAAIISAIIEINKIGLIK